MLVLAQVSLLRAWHGMAWMDDRFLSEVEEWATRFGMVSVLSLVGHDEVRIAIRVDAPGFLSLRMYS
jgi:hypothetical protein